MDFLDLRFFQEFHCTAVQISIYHHSGTIDMLLGIDGISAVRDEIGFRTKREVQSIITGIATFIIDGIFIFKHIIHRRPSWLYGVGISTKKISYSSGGTEYPSRSREVISAVLLPVLSAVPASLLPLLKGSVSYRPSQGGNQMAPYQRSGLHIQVL